MRYLFLQRLNKLLTPRITKSLGFIRARKIMDKLQTSAGTALTLLRAFDSGGFSSIYPVSFYSRTGSLK